MFKGLKDRIANDTRHSSPANDQGTPPSLKKAFNETGNSISQSSTENSPGATPTKTPLSGNGRNSVQSDSEPGTPEHMTGQPGGFFKRLELLSLRNQVAANLTESRDSLNSEAEETANENSAAGKAERNSTPTKIDMDNSYNSQKATPTSSGHDGGGDISGVNVNDVSKEQLLDKIMRLEKTLHKYRERYSNLMERLKSTNRDNEKIKSVMQQLQERHTRRIHEMNEAAELDKQAKMHLEEELNASIEEKLEMIEVLQTQVKLLKSGEDPSQKKQTDSSKLVPEDEVNQLKTKLEIQKKKTLSLQQQLEVKAQDIDNIKKVHLDEKSKLIRQLKQAKSLVEQLEQDKGMALAEAKRLTHEALEVKDAQLLQLQPHCHVSTDDTSQAKESKAKKENAMFEELEAALANVQRLEEEKTSSLQEHKSLETDMQKLIEDHSVKMKKLKENSERSIESLSSKLEISRQEISLKTEEFEKEKLSLQVTLNQAAMEIESLKKRLFVFKEKNQEADTKYTDNLHQAEKASAALQKSLDTERTKSEELKRLLQENEQKHAKEMDDLSASLQAGLKVKNSNLRAEMQKTFALEKESLTSGLQQQFNTEKLELQQAALASEDNKGSEKEAELLSRLQELQKIVSTKTENVHHFKVTLLEKESMIKEIQEKNNKLLAELETKTKDSEVARKDCANIQSDLSQAYSDIQRHVDELSTVKNEIKVKERDLETLTKDLAASNEQLVIARAEKERLMKDFESTKGELISMRTHTQQKEAEVFELTENVRKKNEEFNDLVQTLQVTTKKKEDDATSHRNEVAGLKEAWKEKAKEMKIAREALVAELGKEFLEEKTKLKTEYEKREEELKGKLSSQSMKEKSALEYALSSQLKEEHSTEITSIQEQWKTKYGDLKRKAEQRIVQLQQKTKELQAELEDSKNHLSSIQNQSKAAIKKIETEKLSVEKTNEQLQGRSNHVEKLASQLQSAKRSLQELTSQREEIDSLYQAEVANVKKLKEELEASKNNLVQSERKLGEVQKVLSEKSEILENVQKKSEAMTKKIIELQMLIKTKSGECTASEENLHDALQQVERCNAEVKEKSEEINKLNSTLQEVNTKMQSLEKATTQLKIDLSAVSTERDEAVREHEKAAAFGHLLSEETTTLKSEIESIEAESAAKEADAKKRMKEALDELTKESQAKANELKKKAEQRLAQMKKTFGNQVEDKLGKISALSDANASLEQEVASLKEQNELHQENLDKRIEEQCRVEREKMENHIAELEKTISDISEKTTTDVTAMYEEEKRQLEERIEVALSEYRIKTEETESRMKEEKDRFEVALKEERERRSLAESNLAKELIKQSDVSEKEEAWNATEKEHISRISELKVELDVMNSEREKEKESHCTEKEQLSKEMEISKKRIEKLEKNREVLKSKMKQQLALDEEEKQILHNEVSSLKKQLQVLNQSSSEDVNVETELMLEELKKDFDRRIEEKELEHEEKVKRLIKEYETERMKMEEKCQEQLEKASDRNASSDRLVREQHHNEVLALQKEIVRYEQEMEVLTEKHELDLQTRETEMSEQVDKATFRALTAEKRLQEAGFEDTIKTLQFQVNELSKELSQSQQRQRETASQLDTASMKLSHSSPLADPEKLKYLRQVLYQYMMGAEGKTMAKVLVVFLQYPPEEAQRILEMHAK